MSAIRFVFASAVLVLSPVAARADTVCEWMKFVDQVTSAAAPPADATPTADHAYVESQVALAMFEALDAIDPRYESMLKLPRAERGASQDAAAATAAYKVLLAHFPSQKSTLDDSYRIAMSEVGDAKARDAGRAIGEVAAAGALLRGGVDPKVVLTPYHPRTAPGVWIATALPVIQPFMAAFRPWSLSRVDEVRPGPPPALTSERWARDYNETKRLGGRDSSERTTEQTIVAHFRLAPDLMPTIENIVHQPGRRPVENARLFALYTMADQDAGIAIADAKLFYNAWRPITAIRNGEDDGNPATVADPSWTPLLNTPNHPEYPCGHCIYAAAEAGILKAEAGNVPVGGVRFTTRRASAITQTVPDLDAYVDTVSMGRIYGGVHFRFSNEAAIDMGRKIAAMTIARNFRPLKQ